VIIFPRPHELRRREKVELQPERPGRLPWKVWAGWTRKKSPFTGDQVRHFKDLLEKMNEKLERVGRALGHRVWQSVEYYLANHPAVSAALAAADAAALERAMRVAFEDQVVQKVMPKLRGIETSGKARSECLDPIRGLLEEFPLNLREDFDLAC